MENKYCECYILDIDTINEVFKHEYTNYILQRCLTCNLLRYSRIVRKVEKIINLK